MKKQTQALTEAGREYAAAYAMHYERKNVKEAFGLYRKVMTEFPESAEAAYSRKQIENIATALIPEKELFDVLVSMASAGFAKG